jgi:hypothetical protein
VESVVRAAVIYAFLLIVFRIGGKRTLAQITPFDCVLVLVIAEAVQPALVGGDSSLINAALVVVTLMAIDIGLSLWRQRSRRIDDWTVYGSPKDCVEVVQRAASLGLDTIGFTIYSLPREARGRIDYLQMIAEEILRPVGA